MDGVVLFCQLTGNRHELHAHQGKALGFIALDDIAQPARAVRRRA